MIDLSPHQHIALKMGWQSFCNEGQLTLWNFRGEAYKLSDPLGAKHRLFELLDRNLSYEAVCSNLLAEFPQLNQTTIDQAVNQLFEKGLVEDINYGRPTNWSAQELELFDRQFHVFSGHSRYPQSRYDAQKSLKDTSILVIGVGGVGTWFTNVMAHTGIGKLVLVDYDSVETSNLNRQALYTLADVGKPKVIAAKAQIEAFNPFCKVIAIQEMIKGKERLTELISDHQVNFLVLTVTSLNSQLARDVTSACLETHTSHVFIGGKWIGPLCLPYETACYGCLEETVKEKSPLYERIIDAWLDRATRNHASFAPILTPTPILAALEVSKHITKIADATIVNNVKMFDDDQLTLNDWKVERRKDCALCGMRP